MEPLESQVKVMKPKCKLIGEDGNIFNLMSIASKTLKETGMEEEAKEMIERIINSRSEAILKL